MRALAGLLLLTSLVAADVADDYFEVGVDYLKKGFFGRARAAFCESLVRAPGQPVPLAFLGLASAAEGRPTPEAAILFRWAYERLPKGKALRLDLASLLPSRKSLELLQQDYRRRLASARGAARRDLLTVLAFLEVHDGNPVRAAALDILLEESPADSYGKALATRRKKPRAASAKP